jgi:hypothetical protein
MAEQEQSRLQKLTQSMRDAFFPGSPVASPAGDLDFNDLGTQRKIYADQERLSPEQFKAKYGDTPDNIVRRFGK